MEVKVGGIYRVGRKIGAGSFGEIYLGISKDEISIALLGAEDIHNSQRLKNYLGNAIQLNGEFELLANCSKTKYVGIPHSHWYGKDGDYNILILDLLGPSLEDLFQLCNKKFSVKTVLLIADQILTRIELIHSKAFIYRDIKPDNFLIGMNKKADYIYLIDFGLAKKYRDIKSGQHIEYKEGKSFIGTVRYSSINTHLGREQSRRDDLEAIGYVLMYFLRGSLPWQGVKADNKKEKYDKIGEIKMNTPLEELCKGFPVEFADFIRTVRDLKFDEKPDYAQLKQQFRALFYKLEFQQDNIFDWSKLNSNNVHKKKEIEHDEDTGNNNTREKEDNSNSNQKDDNPPIYKSNQVLPNHNKIKHTGNNNNTNNNNHFSNNNNNLNKMGNGGNNTPNNGKQVPATYKKNTTFPNNNTNNSNSNQNNVQKNITSFAPNKQAGNKVSNLKNDYSNSPMNNSNANNTQNPPVQANNKPEKGETQEKEVGGARKFAAALQGIKQQQPNSTQKKN